MLPHRLTLSLLSSMWWLLLFSLLSRTSAQGSAPIKYYLMEEEPAGFQLGDFPADSGIDNIDPSMTFSITSPTSSPHVEYFAIQLSGGKPNLVTTQIINREKICAQVVLCQIQFNIVVMPIQFFRIIKVSFQSYRIHNWFHIREKGTNVLGIFGKIGVILTTTGWMSS